MNVQDDLPDIAQELEALSIRMRRYPSAKDLDAWMAMSEKDLLSHLCKAHGDSHRDPGAPEIRRDAASVARRAIARRAAIETMEDGPAAERWLNEPSPLLGGQAPIAQIDSDEGLVCVLRALIAIEHGLPP